MDRQAYEYGWQLFHDNDTLITSLNEWGRDGWELVSLIQPEGEAPGFIFKRPVSQARP